MKFISFSAEDTEKIAFDFGLNAKPGDIFCLSGELGAGKTVFAKGFARGVGYEGRVTSPTFAVMNEYTGKLPIYHFDLYRLDAGDLEGIGCEEYFFGNGVSLVEWPERADIFHGANIFFVKILPAENETDRVIYVENFSD
ncbi:MAG: tRNA (adenosine(37)-N6)-threonylcarbamoyltransferase complex ATPase subunit type 1 TsaE [Defluviitaleaceae bacterium]|nr:tRNA (adenosine(37)-N6)-threonylcarbamoyltransferase complex ATPase subunit type 1 TsaE [Defluviitaleaceae bacterium]